ncbi:fumarylacetoacetate hydrolase family protein [Ornithinimicrobium pekingense]|uniref:2-hydroxyhepta-2,4-diene-1,7-dioate isomerase n=1 Tax=Ornithinimicrobium pekingense TaxID=384677 RepID=A0ABQ2F6C4_9MICO|nr:fumarylacetoacetate hydrolase family protein [Ornithinimicrobium pekingense]GGK66435.1 2-hydroxyhepta-2,4-diene-1,7-dioate isomerase [Ornithinimicrobium pekingense]
MKLATVRTPEGTRAARIDEAAGTATLLDAADVGALLERPDWQAAASVDGRDVPLDGVDYAPVVTRPGKIFCVGLNYRGHIQEMGRDLPDYPTVFSKVADTLVGAGDEIRRPEETEAFDWEVELAVVIGRTVRRADEATASDAIAGFAVLNDVTCRDWQFRTREWLQGKNWEATTPLGPWLVTPDEVGGTRPALTVRTTVDGEVMQEDSTGDLLFDPVALVSYLSTMVTLRPGDVIATGTPGGVGHARRPAVYLRPGQRVVTEVEGLGRCDNLVVADGGDPAVAAVSAAGAAV